MIKEWDPRTKPRLRGEILRMLSERHQSQRSRLDDVALCHALRQFAWELDIYDVVTILQDMRDRGWISCRELKNVYMRRRTIDLIAIQPEGQDLLDQLSSDPAVEF